MIRGVATMLYRLGGACVVLGASSLALAQESGRQPLTQGADVIEVPGIGRVVLVFAFIVALAVAAAFVIRRYLPKLSTGFTADGNIRLIGRATPASGLRVQLLSVDGQRVLITENRTSLAVVVLDSARDRNSLEKPTP